MHEYEIKVWYNSLITNEVTVCLLKIAKLNECTRSCSQIQCLIDGHNLKEIDPWETYFHMVQNSLKQCKEGENVMKIGHFRIIYLVHH